MVNAGEELALSQCNDNSLTDGLSLPVAAAKPTVLYIAASCVTQVDDLSTSHKVWSHK